jgi:hypothetical protein
MCESCPDCPECGQNVAEPPTVRYLAGLLAPPVFVLFVGMYMMSRGVSAYTAGLTVGVSSMGAWALLATDEHVKALKDLHTDNQQ